MPSHGQDLQRLQDASLAGNEVELSQLTVNVDVDASALSTEPDEKMPDSGSLSPLHTQLSHTDSTLFVEGKKEDVLGEALGDAGAESRDSGVAAVEEFLNARALEFLAAATEVERQEHNRKEKESQDEDDESPFNQKYVQYCIPATKLPSLLRFLGEDHPALTEVQLGFVDYGNLEETSRRFISLEVPALQKCIATQCLNRSDFGLFWSGLSFSVPFTMDAKHPAAAFSIAFRFATRRG